MLALREAELLFDLSRAVAIGASSSSSTESKNKQKTGAPVGAYHVTYLDEDTLKAIADRTGGRYFRARDAEGLAQIYEILDELEPVESDVETIRPVDELFYWPLGGAWLLAMTAAAMGLRPRMSLNGATA